MRAFFLAVTLVGSVLYAGFLPGFHVCPVELASILAGCRAVGFVVSHLRG
jgi:hypothetical protein